MKKLKKEHVIKRKEFIDKFQKCEDRITEIVNEINELIGKREKELKDLIDEYNVIVEDAEEFKHEVIESIDDYMSDKSSEWHDSEQAKKYDTWVGNLLTLEIDEEEAILIGTKFTVPQFRASNAMKNKWQETL